MSNTALATIRSSFPILDEMAYLQWPYRAALATPVRQAAELALDQHQNEGATARDRWFEEYVQCANTLAGWFGADIADMTWMPNTTFGLAMIANGIDWKSGDEVLVPEGEFPSNVYPWMQLERHGVRVRVVPKDERGAIPAERILDAIGVNTRLVAASHVSFHNGHRIDIAALGKGCRERGVLSVVDAAQSVGWHAISFNDLQVDVLCGVGRKFMCALDGLGFMFIHRDLHPQLHVSVPGPFSVKHDRDYLRHELDFRDDAWKFSGGAIATPQAFALRAVVEMMRPAGSALIMERSLELQRKLRDALRNTGMGFTGAEWTDAEHSALLQVPFDDETIPQRLQDARVSVSVRGGCLRIGTHAWNTEGDIERLLEVLSPPRARGSS